VNGFAADGNTFVKKVKQRLEVCLVSMTRHEMFSFISSFPSCQWYRHNHAKDMPLRSIARLIQTMLYAQRFFPYYVYNILGGIEEDGMLNPFFSSCQASTQLRRYSYAGTGAVYSFDPVGSYEREACRAAGAAQSLVQPLLDNQVSCCVHLVQDSHDVANYLLAPRTVSDLSPTIRRVPR